MKIETKLEFKEYAKLMHLLLFKHLKFFTVITLLLCSIVFYYVVKGHTYNYFIFLFIIVFVYAIILFSVYSGIKKGYYTNKRLQEKKVYEFTVDKITVTGESFFSETKWEQVYQVVEYKHWILIYENKLTAFFIPKSAFGLQIAEFRNLVKTKNVKTKLLKQRIILNR